MSVTLLIVFLAGLCALPVLTRTGGAARVPARARTAKANLTTERRNGQFE